MHTFHFSKYAQQIINCYLSLLISEVTEFHFIFAFISRSYMPVSVSAEIRMWSGNTYHCDLTKHTKDQNNFCFSYFNNSDIQSHIPPHPSLPSPPLSATFLYFLSSKHSTTLFNHHAKKLYILLVFLFSAVHMYIFNANVIFPSHIVITYSHHFNDLYGYKTWSTTSPPKNHI